ncbi:MFS transporter [Streptomyces sp. NPDC127106]|uniref:MFS transporter n=1 Tax=Streptomyces sp. NPDC127106 TaxID=3345360 RepID=UPI003635156A
MSVSVITNTFPEQSRARALGAVFGVANIGTALGPFVGGGSPSAPRELDLPGCALIVCGLAGLTLAVERGDAWGWGSAPTLGCLAAAAASGGLFLVRERLTRHPLIDLRLFRNLPYVLVTAMGSLSNMAYAVTVLLATLTLQGVRGLSPLLAGTVFLAPALMVAVSGPLGARLGRHMGPTAVMALAGAVAGTSCAHSPRSRPGGCTYRCSPGADSGWGSATPSQAWPPSRSSRPPGPERRRAYS